MSGFATCGFSIGLLKEPTHFTVLDSLYLISVAFSQDKELLEYSYTGYLSLNEDHVNIITNTINEGTYKCLVRKKES